MEGLDSSKTLALNVRKIRIAVGISITELSRLSDVCVNQIYGIESGGMVRGVTLGKLFKIAKALGVSPAALVIDPGVHSGDAEYILSVTKDGASETVLCSYRAVDDVAANGPDRVVLGHKYADKLRLSRLNRGFSVCRLADKLGVERTFLGSIENGVARTLSRKILYRVDEVFGLAIEEVNHCPVCNSSLDKWRRKDSRILDIVSDPDRANHFREIRASMSLREASRVCRVSLSALQFIEKNIQGYSPVLMKKICAGFKVEPSEVLVSPVCYLCGFDSRLEQEDAERAAK